ncbi:MAG: hypothetical protein Q8L07_14715 [Sediminibacterium sp.]|nr:hypothetical protein [Sediminibacterium sp.]
MYYLIVFGLIFSAIYLYQIFAGGVEAITAGIQTRWLRITLRILFKIVVFSFVAVGIISTAIVMLAFNYKPGKKD